jgi:hypothetical protein
LLAVVSLEVHLEFCYKVRCDVPNIFLGVKVSYLRTNCRYEFFLLQSLVHKMSSSSMLLILIFWIYFQNISGETMQGDRNKTLTEPSTYHGSHQAVDGINVTTEPARANIEDKKIAALRNILEKDPQAADVKWSLFVAACQSYRYDSCLKPFPPQFINNGIKDIDSLVRGSLKYV